ncbi:MAG: AraC family transcriptional regulator [Ekhidna sp.]
MELSLIQVFIIIGAAQGLILAFSSLYHSKNRNTDLLFFFAFLALSIRLFIYPFRPLLKSNDLNIFNNLSLILLLLVGPSLLLYSLRKIKKDFKLNPLHLLHVIPFAAYLAHVLYPHFKLPICYSYATLYSGIGYGISLLTIVFVTKRSLIESNSSSIHTYSFALPLLLIPSFIYGFSYLQHQILGLHPATLPYLVLTGLLYRMSFIRIKDSKKKHESFTRRISDTMKVDQKDLSLLKEKIENLELYLNPEVSIIDLVNTTGISRHKISSLIKYGLNTTFHDLINKYRVEEVKRKIDDPKFSHFSLLGIAQESGFRSKATFYQAFKKMAGVTPAKYKQSSSLRPF